MEIINVDNSNQVVGRLCARTLFCSEDAIPNINI